MDIVDFLYNTGRLGPRHGCLFSESIVLLQKGGAIVLQAWNKPSVITAIKRNYQEETIIKQHNVL